MQSSQPTQTSLLCPLTGQSMHPWFSIPIDWRQPKTEHPYELYWCDQSQYGMVYPRPTPEQVRSFYDVDYYTHEATSFNARSRSWLEQVRSKLAGRLDFGVEPTNQWWRKTLQRSFPQRPDATVGVAALSGQNLSCCEIGCGSGNTLSQLQKLGCSVIGVEPDRQAREMVRRAGIRVLDGTAEQLPVAIANQRFDVIIFSHVLEHCLDPMLALTNVVSLLKPDGLLILETPNNNAIGCQISGRTWPWLDVPRHLNFFTLNSLQLICQQAGLHCEKVEYRGYWRQFDIYWQQEEREIYQAFARATQKRSIATANPPNLEWRYWLLLFRTLFASVDRKYDSVRILARKSNSRS